MSSRAPSVISQDEYEIMLASLEDARIFCEYFLRPPSGPAWVFDDNFLEEGKWQLSVMHASQTDIGVIGGFATGKTSGFGIAAFVWACLVPDFKFLNVAPRSWQAKQMYDAILSITKGTPAEGLVTQWPQRPHPKIVIEYTLPSGETHTSSIEFMSVDRDATNILSWEGDWLHVDEAGLIDQLDEVIANAGSRARGTIRGRARLGRFSLASNSWDNTALWAFVDSAEADPENFLGIVVSTRHNKNVTEKQLERMLARIPDDEHQRFIDGGRPEGRGSYFSHDAIFACEDKTIAEIAAREYRNGTEGYVYKRIAGVGVWHYEIPPVPERVYVLAGDPGTDNAPKRNSPVLAVFDVTDFPREPARLAAFWWGYGDGKIGPFIDTMVSFLKKYTPWLAGVDSTGPQKNVVYLFNNFVVREHFRNEDGTFGWRHPLGSTSSLVGLDFSGSRKPELLQTLRIFLERRLLIWPKSITGIRSQLTNYDLERDRKMAQDIVATISMLAQIIRAAYRIQLDSFLQSIVENNGDDYLLAGRRTLPARNKRSPRGIPERAPAARQRT